MICRMISTMVVLALLHGSIVAQDQDAFQRQSTAKMQRILHKAQQRGKAVFVTLNNGSRVTGKIDNISDEGFAVIEQKTGTTTSCAYSDVREVRQKGLSKAAEIVVGLGVAFGALVGIFYALYPKT